MTGQFTDKKKRNCVQILCLGMFAVLITCRYYVGVVNCLNTTQYAFSYKYGLVSRGVLGTVVRIINALLHINLLNYDGIVMISNILNLCYLIILLMFFYRILQLAGEKYETKLLAIMFVFGVFAFPEYITEENFGRSDICLVMITLVGCFLLLSEKLEWLLLPLIVLAMSIHQGYILMFLNVLLVILFVKIFSKEGKERAKYMVLLGSSIMIASILLIYFNFFSHQKDLSLYDEIYRNASSYAHDGVVQYNLILHEMFGISPAADEMEEHIHNFCEFPVFLLLTSPYIVIAIRFFRGILQKSKGIIKLKYLAIAMGACTIIPDLLIKIDYGRWMFSILFYYMTTILMLVAMKDDLICEQLDISVQEIKKNNVLIIFLLIYPIMLTPLEDVNICDFSRMIIDHFITPIYP